MNKIVTSSDAAAEILRRQSCEGSLHDFLKGAWPQIEGGRDFKTNWYLEAVCEHLEAVWRGEIRNLVINVPPRHTKSTLVNVAFPAWVWIHQPNLQWLFSSYAWTLAIRDARRCRTLISSQWYKNRWGDRFSLLEDANRMDRYNNDKQGYRITTSVDSATMGDGGDIQVADDPNNTRDKSDTVLQSTLDWWHDVMPSRVNDFLTCRRIVIQQRTHEKDLSGHIIRNDLDKSWVKLVLPLEFEEKRRCVTVPLKSTGGKPWQDPRKKEGDIIDPERMDAASVKRLKKDLGSEYAISGQLQQRPAPSAGGIIKRSWFKLWNESSPPQCEFTVMSVDTALSESKDSAYNAATTWGVFRDGENVPNIILLSVWRERCEYPELRSRIIRMSRNYLDDGITPRDYKLAPDILLIEAKVSGISLIQDLRRADVMAVPFKPDKLGDKLQRVRLVTPLLESGRVWVPAAPPDWKEPRRFADTFITQCISFPNAEARDTVDTMTMAFWKLMSMGFVWSREDVGEREAPYREYGGGGEAFYG